MKHVGGVGRPEGGSGALPVAIAGALVAHGGRVRTGTQVVAVECEGDRVRGVRLADGTSVRAPVVVVASDPRTAIVEWLRNPPAAAGPMVEKWRSALAQDGYESKVDAVVTAPPRYRDVPESLVDRLGVDTSAATMVVAPGLDAFHDAHRAYLAGTVAERPMLLANVPTVADPCLAPARRHVLSLEVLYTPYELRGGWAASGEPERWLRVYGELLEPGFERSLVAWRAVTPPVYEEELRLPRGHATSFAGGPLAALRGRDPELTRYETPVRGLFLTGAATFPGAGVWGAPGRNAAHVILARG
jgi:phytoene dehydrogenase-like protein